MRICYFGKNKDVSRGKNIIKGLLKNDVEIIQIRSNKFIGVRIFYYLYKYFTLSEKCDYVLVGSLGQLTVILLRFFIRKKIILDSFVSLYNTAVEDRKHNKKYSWQAGWYYFLDWSSIRLADIVLLDTKEHIDYFQEKFRYQKDKFVVIPVGTDNNIFKPKIVSKNVKFIVWFHGTYIPLHGIEKIIQAANILKDEHDIQFKLLGTGQTLNKIKRQVEKLDLNNIELIAKRVPYESLSENIAVADVCLGIFGNTKKADMVVPNKIFEYLAMKKPIITKKTKALEKFIRNENEIVLVDGDLADNLAKEILRLKDNKELRDSIAENGYNLFINNYIPSMIGKILVNEIKKYGN